jgi:hypothetical protein
MVHGGPYCSRVGSLHPNQPRVLQVVVVEVLDEVEVIEVVVVEAAPLSRRLARGCANSSRA